MFAGISANVFLLHARRAVIIVIIWVLFRIVTLYTVPNRPSVPIAITPSPSTKTQKQTQVDVVLNGTAPPIHPMGWRQAGCPIIYHNAFKCLRSSLLGGERSDVAMSLFSPSVREQCKWGRSQGLSQTVFIDVGANDGHELSSMHRVLGLAAGCANITYVVVEPNTRYHATLRTLVPAREATTVLVGAVASTDEYHNTTAFLVGEGERARMSMTPRGESRANKKGVPVRVVSLHRLLQERHLGSNGSVAIPFIKIDAEGADGIILRSLLPILRDHDVVVVYELSSWYRLHTPVVTPSDVVRDLSGVGYDVYLFGSHNETRVKDFFIRAHPDWLDSVAELFRWETAVALRRGGTHHRRLRGATMAQITGILRSAVEMRKASGRGSRSGKGQKQIRCADLARARKTLKACLYGNVYIGA
eukprot:PhM_4_TR8200/c0_g1_i1/m.2745